MPSWSSCGEANVCLPEDYYYDTKEEIAERCWHHAKPQIKIQVERCGCSAASFITPAPTLAVVVIFMSAFLLRHGAWSVHWR